MREQKRNYHHHERDSRQKLLTVHMYSENGISVCLNRREDLAAHKRRAKTEDSADAVFNSRRLCKISAVNVAVRNIRKVSGYSCHTNIIKHGVNNDQKCGRRSGKNIDEHC